MHARKIGFGFRQCLVPERCHLRGFRTSLVSSTLADAGAWGYIVEPRDRTRRNTHHLYASRHGETDRAKRCSKLFGEQHLSARVVRRPLRSQRSGQHAELHGADVARTPHPVSDEESTYLTRPLTSIAGRTAKRFLHS